MGELYLLMSAPTGSTRILFDEKQTPTLIAEQRFRLDSRDRAALVGVLRAAKEDPTLPSTTASETYLCTYQPFAVELQHFTITHKASGRIMTFALSTGWRLLNALMGETENLRKEEVVDVRALLRETHAFLTEVQALLTDDSLIIEDASEGWFERRDALLAKIAEMTRNEYE